MSTAAVSSNSIYQQLQVFFQQRRSDLQKLGKDLQAGDLSDAQQDYQALQTLGQSGPFANGDTFAASSREQDFQNIGTALQSGDLADAQKALLQLHRTFEPPPVAKAAASASSTSPASSTGAATSTSSATSTASTNAATSASSAGAEIVLNLGNMPAGEQITIGLSSGANGAEQVAISAENSQGQSDGQILLNLAQNSNEEIVLNLFNSSTNTTTPASSLNVSA